VAGSGGGFGPTDGARHWRYAGTDFGIATGDSCDDDAWYVLYGSSNGSNFVQRWLGFGGQKRGRLAFKFSSDFKHRVIS
jgi:hypothetical protein